MGAAQREVFERPPRCRRAGPDGHGPRVHPVLVEALEHHQVRLLDAAPEHAVVLVAEDADLPVDLVRRDHVRPEHVREDADGRFQLLGHDDVRPGRRQRLDIAEEADAGDDLDGRVEVARLVDRPRRGRRVAHHDDGELGPLDAGRLQQVRPRRVAVERADALRVERGDGLGVHLDDDERDARVAEDAHEVRPGRPVTDHDHVVFERGVGRGVRLGLGPEAAQRRRREGGPDARPGTEQERREQHQEDGRRDERLLAGLAEARR